MYSNEDPQAYLAKLAKQNVCEGILHEPRLFYDDLIFTAGGVTLMYGDDDVFVNGEQYPVRITHILAYMGGGATLSPQPAILQGDERLLQRFGMRIRTHDTFYMGPQFVPFPLWHNVPTAIPESVGRGNTTWRFDRPFPLGQRDAFIVDLQLLQVPGSARLCGVTFCGVGRESRRPERFSGTVSLTDTTRVQVDPNELRSQGAEVVDIHSMSLHCGGAINSNDAGGDTQQLLVGIRQTGNGTNAQWQQGPTVGLGGVAPLCPQGLWGPTTGRACVHRLPSPWLWQPGQGVNIEVQNFDVTRQATVGETVWVGMLGHVIVT